jgi:hypothetical protein
VGRNGVAVFSAVQHREAFHGLGIKMSQNLILIDALSFACWEKKEKQVEKRLGAFFLGLEARYTLLAVHSNTFEDKKHWHSM